MQQSAGDNVDTRTPLPAAVEAFVAGLIAAAAANHADGETGETIRRLEGDLVRQQRELACCRRRHGVRFSLADHMGNVSLGIRNDK